MLGKPSGDQLLKSRQNSFPLAIESDDGKERNFPAELLRVAIGVIATDQAGFFQPADASQAGRCGDPGTPCQFDIRHPAVNLQLGKDPTVNRIQQGWFCGLQFHESRFIG